MPANLGTVTALEVGSNHSCALDAVGVHCWGWNYNGQISVPAGLVNPVAVTAGSAHTCALTTTSVTCWGYNGSGQASVPVLDFDTDRDGLQDALEDANGNGVVDAGETDPLNPDTDGDGLVDGVGGWLPVASYPGGVDANGDGFVDGEQDYGNDPTLADYADGNIALWGAPDSVVDLADYLVAVRIVSGQLVLSPTQLQQALGHIDLNRNGQLEAGDLVRLQQMLP